MIITVSAVAVLMVTIPCDETKAMMAYLQSRYGESPIAMGIQRNSLVQMTMGIKGTWSIVRTDPTSGLTCIVAAGDNWVEKPRGEDL